MNIYEIIRRSPKQNKFTKLAAWIARWGFSLLFVITTLIWNTIQVGLSKATRGTGLLVDYRFAIRRLLY